jgi:dTMP kinase
MTRPLFLSLDGIDGAGKSTQCRLLVEWLRAAGHVVTPCRDPGGTPVGDRIRELLLDRRSEMSVLCEAFLYMASRSQLVEGVIRPALARGEIVVADRFLLANVVYQGHAGGLPPARLWELGQLATGGLLPDLSIVLDLDVQVSTERKTGPRDRMESKGQTFIEAVRAGFLAEAQRDPERIRVVDASRPAEEVAAAIRQEVSRVLGTSSRP